MFHFRNELFDDVCEKMEETRREALREMDEAKEKKGGKATAKGGYCHGLMSTEWNMFRYKMMKEE